MRVQYPELVWGAIASSGTSRLPPPCMQAELDELTNQPSHTLKSISRSTLTLYKSTARQSVLPLSNRQSSSLMGYWTPRSRRQS
jgi:hypothetical protein